MADVSTGHSTPPLLVRTSSDTRRLLSGQFYTIGRDPAADVPVSDARVSWQHAVLRVDGGRWVLEDGGSRNGTFAASGARIDRLEITGPCAVWLTHPADGPVLRLEPEPDPVPGSSTAPSWPGAADHRPAGGGAAGADPGPAAPEASPGGPAYGYPQGGVRPDQEPGPYPGAYPGAPAEPGSYPGAPAGPVPPEGAGRSGRYLKGRCPSGVRVGETFSLLVGIVRDAPGSGPLEYAPVGAQWQDVIVALDAPGGEFLSNPRDVIHVPPGADSEPVRFELRAASAGPLRITARAWAGQAYLGELTIEVAVARYRIRRAAQRDTVAGIDLR